MLRFATLFDEHVAQRPLFSTPVLTAVETLQQIRAAEASATAPPGHRYTRVVGFVCVVYELDLYGCGKRKASKTSCMAANRPTHDKHKQGAPGGGGLETKNAFWIIDASYIRKRVGETGGVVGVGNGMLIASPDGLHTGEG